MEKTNKNKEFIIGNQDVDTSFMALEMVWQGLRGIRIKEQVGVPIHRSFLEMIKGNAINYFVEAEGSKTFVNQCVYQVFNNEELLLYLKSETEKSTKEIRDLARSVIGHIATLNNQDVILLLQKIKKLQIDCTFYGTLVAFADIFGDITNNLINITQRKNGLKRPIHIYTSTLGLPEAESLTQVAYRNIVLSNNNTQQLLSEYFWLDQGYIGQGLTEVELTNIKNAYTDKPKLNREELFSELNLNVAEHQAFVTSQDIIFMKAIRVDSRQFLYVVMNRIVERFSRELNIESRYLLTLSVDEFCKLISGDLTLIGDLEKRWAHSVFTEKDDNNFDVVEGSDVDSFLKQNIYSAIVENNKVVKGQVAFPGKVQGSACLIFGPQHIGKVKPGNILVASATSPQFLPAMKIAGAFVTDVGGITSHAAIVARELKIPCIVGTKIATQIFKTGDMLEVDADKGIVRIL